MTSHNTTHVLQQMPYLRGMSYARTRLQNAKDSRASGKGRQVRSLTFFNPNSQKWANDAPGLTSFASKATSGKFSDYRAEHEAAVARKAFLEAQLETNQAAACLSESKAECDCDHQAITQG